MYVGHKNQSASFENRYHIWTLHVWILPRVLLAWWKNLWSDEKSKKTLLMKEIVMEKLFLQVAAPVTSCFFCMLQNNLYAPSSDPVLQWIKCLTKDLAVDDSSFTRVKYLKHTYLDINTKKISFQLNFIYWTFGSVSPKNSWREKSKHEHGI